MSLEIIVVLLAAVLLLTWLARTLKMTEPVVLLLGASCWGSSRSSGGSICPQSWCC